MLKLLPKHAYQEDFVIRTYETGQKKEALVTHLLKLMHEAAMQNVMELKVSVWDLESDNISWVLRQMNLQIFRLPILGESIKIITNPAGFHRLFTFRDYRVYDAKGILIAQSASKWLLMNTAERKLSPIPQFITDFEMPAPEDCLPRPVAAFPVWEKAQNTQQFKVGWHELDFNGHLNNVVYLNWMLEPLDRGILENAKLQNLDILYRSEAQWKDEVVAEVQAITDYRFLHRLMRKEDGKELATALSEWAY